MKNSITKFRFLGIILLFETLLFCFIATYNLNFLGIIMLIGAWAIGDLWGLVICNNSLPFKRRIPLIFFLLSFFPFVLLINIDAAFDFLDKLPLIIQACSFFSLLFISPLSIFLGWTSLYLLSRHTKAQTSLNSISLFIITLLLLSAPTTLIARKVFNTRVEKDVAKTKAQTELIIDKLEEYHSQNESYPQKLEGLDVDKKLTHLSWFKNDLQYSSNTDSYIIGFYIPIWHFSYWSYDSSTTSWKYDSGLFW